jgi:hypothetical protein
MPARTLTVTSDRPLAPQLAVQVARMDLSEAVLRDAVDGTLHLPPWRLLALREAFLTSDADLRASLLPTTVPVGWTDPDVEALARALGEGELPQRTSLILALETAGMPGRAGYEIMTSWRFATGRELLQQPTVGLAFLRRSRGAAPETLTARQAAVLALLAELRPVLGRDRVEDRLAIHRLQALATDRSVHLASYLRDVRVALAERIAPRLRPAGPDTWRLSADVPGQPPGGELPTQRLVSSPSGALLPGPRDGAGVRTTSVLPPAAATALEAVQRQAGLPLSTAEVARRVSHPDAHFSGEGFDLSDFSDRVTGLGSPLARCSIALRETEPQRWWSAELAVQLEVLSDEDLGGARPPSDGGAAGAGREAEAGAGGAGVAGDDVAGWPTQGPTIGLDAARARALLDELDAAAERGDTFIALEGHLVPVTPALREAAAAALTLEADRGADGRLRRPPKEVLRLHDNLEALTFDRSRSVDAAAPVVFERPPHLAPNFELKAHQVEGVRWLLQAEASGLPGVLFADDMGMGKTLQVLSFLDLRWHRAGARRACLVVAPAGLLRVWTAEAQRFFGTRFEPALIAPGAAQLDASDTPPAVLRARLEGHALVVMSYETLRRHQVVLARVHWDVIVADEAHRANNPATATWLALAGMKGKLRVAMTGTPVENGLRELWAIVEAAHPGLLGELRRFGRAFVVPLRGADHGQRRAIADELHAKLRGSYLRRMKRDHLGGELPPKRHCSHVVPLSDDQARRYRELVAAADPSWPLPTLGALLMLSAHPALQPRVGAALPTLAAQPFPKGERLLELVADAAARREKVLIFSRWRVVSAWIAAELRAAHGVTVDVIDGDVDATTQRVAIVERFERQPGFAALVLAPRAAGVGLTMTAANHVIHYTREWNPAVEDQATDRVYRIGQKRGVHVHTIETCFPAELDELTVEQRLAHLLERKRAVADAFVLPVGADAVSAEELAESLFPHR